MSEIEYSITCTSTAIIEAKKQIIKRNKQTAGIRLGIVGGGCSGFAILIEFADEIKINDHIFTFNDVSFFIDPKSMVYLNGTEVDYNTGLMGHGFKLNIPGKVSSCSCGESISF